MRCLFLYQFNNRLITRKELDFLLPGEHERYLEKFGITSQLNYQSKI